MSKPIIPSKIARVLTFLGVVIPVLAFLGVMFFAPFSEAARFRRSFRVNCGSSLDGGMPVELLVPMDGGMPGNPVVANGYMVTMVPDAGSSCVAIGIPDGLHDGGLPGGAGLTAPNIYPLGLGLIGRTSLSCKDGISAVLDTMTNGRCLARTGKQQVTVTTWTN